MYFGHTFSEYINKQKLEIAVKIFATDIDGDVLETASKGIGLAIVKKIIENHEGFGKATSILNNETVFTIVLPKNQLIR